MGVGNENEDDCIIPFDNSRYAVIDKILKDQVCGAGGFEVIQTLGQIKGDPVFPGIDSGRPEESDDVCCKFRMELNAVEQVLKLESLHVGPFTARQPCAVRRRIDHVIRMTADGIEL